MASTALDRVDPIQALTQAPWIDQLHERQLALIQNTVAKGLSKPEVGQFLELARSLGMNPWAREIWAAKGQGKDGKEGQLLIMVGRDGLIGHAERNFADYRGYDAGVVYENDTFERVAPDPDGKTLRERAGVVHRQGHPKDRGSVVGAWAAAERAGRPPRYFYADLAEYMPKSEGKIKYSPWGSALSIMIEKVPISIVHRTLCGLGAVYLEEEVARAFDGEATAVEEEDGEALAQAILEHVPDEHIKPALGLVREMNELAPGSWTASKVEMVFKGKDAKAAKAEMAAISRQIEELRARPAGEPPVEEEHVEDADVVEEQAAAGAAPAPGAWEERERTAEEEAKLVRVADLEDQLREGDLTEQQVLDAQAEIDHLSAELPPDPPPPGQDVLPL
jgi:hypothetical protein